MNDEERVARAITEIPRAPYGNWILFDECNTETKEIAFRMARAAIKLLSAPLDPQIRFKDYHLSRSEARILAFLLKAGDEGLARERLYQALYGAVAGDPPMPKIFDVFISRIRCKLTAAESPLLIETIHGFGWKISSNSDAPLKPNDI